MESAEQSNAAAPPSASHNSIAEIVIAGSAVLFGFVAWFMYHQLLATLFSHNIFATTGGVTPGYYVATVFVFLVYLAGIMVVLQFSSKRVLYSTIAVLAATPLTMFLSQNLITATAIGLLFAAILILVHTTIQRSYQNQIRYTLTGVMRLGLPVLILFTIIAISLFHYISLSGNKETTYVIESSIVRYSVGGLNIFMNRLEGYSPDMTIDDFILLAGSEGLLGGDATVTATFEKQLHSVVDFEHLSDGILQQQRAAIRTSFLEALGITDDSITGETSIEDVWKIYVRTKSSKILTTYDRFLPAILSLGVFLSLLFVNKILLVCVMGVSWVLIHTMRLAGILHYHEERITVKRLTY